MEVVEIRRARVVATVPVRATAETQPVTTVHAPVAGRVLAVHVAPGEMVAAGAPLVRLDGAGAGALVVRAPTAGVVARLDVAVGDVLRDVRARLLVALTAISPLVLEGDVEASVLRRTHVGDRALFVAAGAGTPPLEARLVALDAAPAHGGVTATVGNADGALVPPVAGELRVLVDDAAGTLLVPSRALVGTPAGPVLYVELAPGRYVRRLVEVVTDDGVVAGVGRGVQEGTRVVRDGAGVLARAD